MYRGNTVKTLELLDAAKKIVASRGPGWDYKEENAAIQAWKEAAARELDPERYDALTLRAAWNCGRYRERMVDYVVHAAGWAPTLGTINTAFKEANSTADIYDRMEALKNRRVEPGNPGHEEWSKEIERCGDDEYADFELTLWEFDNDGTYLNEIAFLGGDERPDLYGEDHDVLPAHGAIAAAARYVAWSRGGVDAATWKAIEDIRNAFNGDGIHATVVNRVSHYQ